MDCLMANESIQVFFAATPTCGIQDVGPVSIMRNHLYREPIKKGFLEKKLLKPATFPAGRGYS